MKIVLFAHRNVGLECVKYVNSNNLNTLIVLPPNDDGLDGNFKSVKKFVIENNLPYVQPDSMNNGSFLKTLMDFNPNTSFSCYFPLIIPSNILSIFKEGSFNLHGAILPDYRGTFSGVWSLINDEKYSGSTIHYMDKNIDTGNIIEVKKCEIGNNDTGYTLYEKTSMLSISLFKKYCNKLINGERINGFPQNLNDGNYYPRKLPYGGKINWSWSSNKIDRFCRALNFPPFKCATTILNAKEIEIARVKILNFKSTENPGYFYFEGDKLHVSTSTNELLIDEIKLLDKSLSSDEVRNFFDSAEGILGNN